MSEIDKIFDKMKETCYCVICGSMFTGIKGNEDDVCNNCDPYDRLNQENFKDDED